MTVLIHVVTWNSSAYIEACISSVVAQEGVTLGSDYVVHVTDNASSDETEQKVASLVRAGISFSRNTENIGFSGGHNQGVYRAVNGGHSHILILNPDVFLMPNCLKMMLLAGDKDGSIGLVTPKLMRADSSLQPLSPAIIDAAGMYITKALRHFDRGSGEEDTGQFDDERYVFGGTGACVLVSIECAWSVALPAASPGDGVFELYPQLSQGIEQRVCLFDEAFFAYREDADLAWRARKLGWRCLYAPTARAYHVRVVTPERRSEIPKDYNLYSVRNRFLLQLNNWSFRCGWSSFFNGILLRNMIVIVGVFFKEQSSLPGLFHVVRLLYRADKLRGEMSKRRREVRMRSPAASLKHLNEEQ